MVTKVKQKSTPPVPEIESVQEITATVKVEPTAIDGWLTLETLLYIVIFSLSLGLRLAGLGHYPLSDVEAQQSLPAFRLSQAETLDANANYSPLLVSLDALIFFLIQDSEATARLAPVLFGMCLILLPFSFRRYLGEPLCLLASALLALSPAALFLSRTLNPEIAIATGALMIIASFFNWVEEGGKRWLYLLAGGVAVLLTAGPMAYSMILIFAVISLIKLPAFKALWLQGLKRAFEQEKKPVFSEKTGFSAQENQPEPETAEAKKAEPGWPVQLRQAGIFLGVTLFLLSTAATTNLSGFSVTTGLFSDWLSRFSFGPRLDSGFNAVFLLTLYETLMVVAGLVGLALVILRGDLLRFVFAAWFIAAIILDLAMAGRPAGNIILSLTPLAFLAAIALAELWAGLRTGGGWANEGLILGSGLVISVLSYILLTDWLTRACGPDTPFCPYHWLLSIATLTLFLVIIIFFWFVNGPDVALRGLALTGVALGLLLLINAGSRLNYGSLMNLAYQPLAGAPASTRLVDLKETLINESLIRSGDKNLLDITLLATTPALDWQLRAFEHVTRAGSTTKVVTTNSPTPAIITPITTTGLDLRETYLGQDFAINSVWSPVGLPAKELINWLIYRKTNQPPQAGDSIILWLQPGRGQETAKSPRGIGD